MDDAAAIEALEALLSEGLELCARAQRLDQVWEMSPGDDAEPAVRTMCATPALWVQDQYERDLEAWEAKVRSHLRNHGRTRDVRGLTTTAETIRREIHSPFATPA